MLKTEISDEQEKTDPIFEVIDKIGKVMGAVDSSFALEVLVNMAAMTLHSTSKATGKTKEEALAEAAQVASGVCSVLEQNWDRAPMFKSEITGHKQ